MPTNNRHSPFDAFLGRARFQAFFYQLHQQSAHTAEPQVNIIDIIIASLLALTPVILTLLHHAVPTASLDLPTIAFGIAALLAILHRKRLGIVHINTLNWKQAFSITHTAFAVSCIPAIIIIAISPDLFANKHDAMTSVIGQKADLSYMMYLLRLVLAITLIAAWTAFTEEIIFRGLLVSVLRRLRWGTSQRMRDVFACVLSGAVFGGAHYGAWGGMASLALMCIGLGLAMGYLASGEKLSVVVAYHFLFNLLSLALAVFL